MSKKTILIATGFLLTVLAYFTYQKITSINQEKLFNSYQNYLNEESLSSEKKFGKLNQNKKVILKTLHIDNCHQKNDEHICHIQTEIENFRGLEKENLIMSITDNNQTYKINNMRVEVK